MFGNWRDQKSDSTLTAPTAAASGHTDATAANPIEDPAAEPFGASPLPAAQPATIRRRNFVTPPQSEGPADRPIDRLRQRIPGAQAPGNAQTAPSKESQRLVVGARIHLKGEVTKCDALIVEGHFEGSANSRSIQVTRDGTVDGEAGTEIAEISGKFDGNLTVSDKLIVRSTGRVTGTIRYSSIEVEPGGQISGNVEVTADEHSAVTESASATAPQPADRTEAVEDTVLAS